MKSEQDPRDIGQALRAISNNIRGHKKPRRVPRRSGAQTRIVKRARKPVKRQAVTISKTSRIFNFEQHGAQAYDDPSSNLRRLVSDPNSLVIAVHGNCKLNGLSWARASYGVFVSQYAENLNRNGPAPDPFMQTSQSAELYATMKALDVVHDLIIVGEDLSHVIIKTGSAYLERGLSDFIWKWALNGFRNTDGKPVANGRMFRFLHERLMLEKEYGVRVSFGLVRKDQNPQAVALGQQALS